MDDVKWMHRALALAARGLGKVEPNPMVGAVVVREGRIVGEGWHERFGGPHAEVNALADCRSRGFDPRGLGMVVTLEPCCHTGKTGPCTEALIEARIARVVVAMVDPDPRVAGQGVERMRAAGVIVEVGVCEAEAWRLNEAFVKRITTGLPWVIVKWAQTLDGKTATASGHSQWISNEQSRAVVHRLRGRVDAVMVGAGTVIADDPSLTARPPDPSDVLRIARRVVVDRTGRMARELPGAKMLHDGGPPVTVIDGDLREGLRQLAGAGVTNVLVEGGATLVGALFAAGLVDQVLVFVAPMVLGDAAMPAVRGLMCGTMDEARAMELVVMKRLGDDVMLDYRTPPA